jgi:hypothetical protein
MTTDILILLSTYLGAISLATERFVALVKSIFPWLSTECKDATGLIDTKKEQWRTLLVQVVSLIGAWITTSLLNEVNFDPTAGMYMGHEAKSWKAGVIALLSTGGSAFWNNVLGYFTAVKDIKKQQRAEQRMDLVERSNQLKMPIAKLSKI